MKKRNRRMKQRDVYADSWLVALKNRQPIDQSEIDRVDAGVRLAFEKLKTGAGTQADFIVLESAINIALMRAEQIHGEVVEAMQEAGRAVLECAGFWKRHGKYVFTGPGMAAIAAGLDVYRQMLELSTPKQMHDAANEADRRILAGHVLTPAEAGP